MFAEFTVPHRGSSRWYSPGNFCIQLQCLREAYDPRQVFITSSRQSRSNQNTLCFGVGEGSGCWTQSWGVASAVSHWRSLSDTDRAVSPQLAH